MGSSVATVFDTRRLVSRDDAPLPPRPHRAAGRICDLNTEPLQVDTYLIGFRPIAPLPGRGPLGDEPFDDGTLIRGKVAGVSARSHIGGLQGPQPKSEQRIACGD